MPLELGPFNAKPFILAHSTTPPHSQQQLSLSFRRVQLPVFQRQPGSATTKPRMEASSAWLLVRGLMRSRSETKRAKTCSISSKE